jgi:hypothetical protein
MLPSPQCLGLHSLRKTPGSHRQPDPARHSANARAGGVVATGQSNRPTLRPKRSAGFTPEEHSASIARPDERWRNDLALVCIHCSCEERSDENRNGFNGVDARAASRCTDRGTFSSGRPVHLRVAVQKVVRFVALAVRRPSYIERFVPFLQVNGDRIA